MSVVAAKVYNDHIEVAADSIVIRGGMKRTGTFSKLECINDMIIGSCGSAQEISLMWQFAKTHKPESATERDILAFMVEFLKWKKDFNGDPETENEYVIAYGGRLFEVEDAFVNVVSDYVAIGAGMYFSTAALYLGQSPRAAVKVACDLNCFVSEPIVSYEMKTA